MAWPLLIPLLSMGASAIGGALSNRKKTQTATPTVSPEFGPLQQMLIGNITKRLQQPSALPAGFETGGISAINKTFDAGQQSLENTLSARGLSRSPMAGAAINRGQGRRIGEIARFRTGLPLLERQLQQEDETAATDLLGLGRGTEFSSSGNKAGGALGGLAEMLGFLIGQGAFPGVSRAGGGAGKVPSLYQGF